MSLFDPRMISNNPRMMAGACLRLVVVQSCLVRAMMLHTHTLHTHTHSESLTRTTIGLKLRPKTLGSNQDPHFAWGNVAVRAFSVPARGEAGGREGFKTVCASSRSVGGGGRLWSHTPNIKNYGKSQADCTQVNWRQGSPETACDKGCKQV
jgi:hypothetical protein